MLLLKKCLEIIDVPNTIKSSPVNYFVITENEIVFNLMNEPYVLYKLKKEKFNFEKPIFWEDIEKINLREIKKIKKGVENELFKRENVLFLNGVPLKILFYDDKGRLYISILNKIYVFEGEKLITFFPINFLTIDILDTSIDNSGELWILVNRENENLLLYDTKFKLKGVFTLNRDFLKRKLCSNGKIVVENEREIYVFYSFPFSIYKIEKNKKIAEKIWINFQEKEKRLVKKIISGNFLENLRIICLLVKKGRLENLKTWLYLISPTHGFYTSFKVFSTYTSFNISFIDRNGLIYSLNNINGFKIFQFQFSYK